MPIKLVGICASSGDAMWKCRCGTENRTPGKRCYSCRRPKDVEKQPLMVGCISIALIAFAAMMIGLFYQIPALKHYGGTVTVLFLGLGTLGIARSTQKRGHDGDNEFPITKEESPICFWFDVTMNYAMAIVFIVVAIIKFFVPNFLL